jgi:iron complex transport system substrate-binding protein
VAAAEPEIVLVMPCGYDAPRAHEEALAHGAELAALGPRRLVALKPAAYVTRPGPRLVDGLELMGHILHPQVLPKAPGEAIAVAVEPNSGRTERTRSATDWV